MLTYLVPSSPPHVSDRKGSNGQTRAPALDRRFAVARYWRNSDEMVRFVFRTPRDDLVACGYSCDKRNRATGHLFGKTRNVAPAPTMSASSAAKQE